MKKKNETNSFNFMVVQMALLEATIYLHTDGYLLLRTYRSSSHKIANNTLQGHKCEHSS